MRKLLNKLLIRFGLLITKAPLLLANPAQGTSQSLPAELTEKVKVREASGTPDNELFRIFSADTDVHKWHHYFDIYSRYFQRYRDHPIRMLEIGVFRGGSLRMWKEYFHEDSTIVGIDIDKSCVAHEIAEQNVYVRIGSQADPNFLAAVNGEFGPFDIILDDGSHKTHHQVLSFGALFRSALKDGGCYMVEDTHTNYWIKHVDSPETFIEVSKHMVDMLHEAYFDRKETNFRHGHDDALQELEVSYLSANLAGISFHDSVVVFEKATRDLPKSELR
jgi:cephalosporin hydroxylase